jgi:hypothetical protein
MRPQLQGPPGAGEQGNSRPVPQRPPLSFGAPENQGVALAAAAQGDNAGSAAAAL